jgi:hypothetical protein
MKKNPIVLSSESDGRIILIEFIDGRKYKIQHPGNRTWMEWQQEMFDLENGINNIGFLDNVFEHCVIPEGHTFKPDIDNVKPRELEVWQKFLRNFLRGEIHAPNAPAGRTEKEESASEEPTQPKRRS